MASDTGRERVVGELSNAYAQGLFGTDTFSRRVESAFAANSDRQLRSLVADLPRPVSWRERVEALWERHIAARLPQKAGPQLVATIRIPVPRLAVGQRALVGRGDDVHLPIDHDTVSRRHAALTFDGTSFMIEDLGSTNGTWVNGWRIDRPQRLMPGDELVIATVRLVLIDKPPR